MPLSLQEILKARLEQLGGKTAYWLAVEIEYEPKNIYRVMQGKRALPDEYVPRLLRVLKMDPDGEDAAELLNAIAISRAKLKDDVAPTVEKLQRDILRLSQQLDRMNRVIEQQRGQLAILREQRETASSKVRDLTSKVVDQNRQIVDLGKVIARLELLEAERRVERNKR